MDVRVALRTCSLFAGLSEADLESIARIARLKTYGRGELVFREGDPATHFYGVAAGKVKLYKISFGGRTHIVRVVLAGETFAEAAALSCGTYPVFAETVTKSTLLVFEARPFIGLVSSDGHLAVKVVVSLSRRLENVVNVLGQLALTDLTARVAKYILDLSLKVEKAGMDETLVRLDVRKSDLAAGLGAVSESLSRSLAKLRKGKIIEVKGNEIRILDSEALARTAAGISD
jgi:CRP/FNR family transcriptional regulator